MYPSQAMHACIQEVPLTAGRGGSVDHLCDTDGCINPAHCIPAATHKENTDRIGCIGVGLHSIGEVICGVVPCKHAHSAEDGSVDPMSGCRRLYTIPAPEVYDIKADLVDDLENALAYAVEVKTVKRRKF